MQNEDRTSALNKQYEDGLFRLIMSSAAEYEGEQLLKENSLNADATEDFLSEDKVRAFSKLLDSKLTKKKVPKSRRPWTILNRVAGFMLVTVLTFSTLMISVDAFRVRVLNFLINITPEATIFQLVDGSNSEDYGDATVDWTNSYVPTYIPEGFALIEEDWTASMKTVTFENKDEGLYFTFDEYLPGNAVNIDTENTEVMRQVLIDGHLGNLSVKDSITSIVWKLSDRLFLIQGTISAEEALKIAESVAFYEEMYYVPTPEDCGDATVDWTNSYVPTYIPDGFVVTQSMYTDKTKKIILRQVPDDTFIMYSEYSITMTLATDTEGASVIEPIIINECEGTLSIKGSIVTIVWKMDDRLFVVHSQTSKEEAIKIAEGVVFVD